MPVSFWKELTPYIVPLIVILIMARRLKRNQARKVKVNRLFIMPLVIMALTGITLAATPMPSLLWLAGYALALIAGGAVGFLTAHHQEFSLDYDTGTISSRATPLGTMLVAGLFAIRLGLKFVFPSLAGSPYQVSSYTPNSPVPHLPAHAGATLIGWTDAGLIFSTALLVARAATTYFRAQPLVHAHKAHVAAKSDQPAP